MDNEKKVPETKEETASTPASTVDKKLEDLTNLFAELAKKSEGTKEVVEKLADAVEKLDAKQDKLNAEYIKSGMGAEEGMPIPKNIGKVDGSFIDRVMNEIIKEGKANA